MVELREGNIVKGEVKNIVNFGAFVRIEGINKDGLIHISEIDADNYVNDVSNYLSQGDKINVKVIKIKYEQGEKKIDLSWKQVPEDKKWVEIKNNSRFLPEDTRLILGEERIENFYLLVNKYLDQFEGRSEFNNKELLKQMQKSSGRLLSDKLIEEVKKRSKRQLSALDKDGYQTVSFTMTNDYRVVVGLGGANVLETNLLLHHVYGLPYIPGSAVKGVAKSWALERLSELSEIKDYEKLENLLESDELQEERLSPDILNQLKDYRRVFGTQKRVGEVMFLNSFPEGKVKVKVDVMTPHHTDYYGEMESSNPRHWPVDHKQPKPIPFLALEGPTFNFRLAALGREDQELLQTASSLVKSGLKELGVGAKTLVGYGYFEE